MNVDRFFVDTNLLLYWIDSGSGEKQKKADAWLTWLWEGGCGVLSWQVLHEFYFNGERKLRHPQNQLQKIVASLQYWQFVPTTLGLVQRAWHWQERAQLQYWDALILAAAERGPCSCLLSEDFQSGRTYGSVKVVNPFSHSPADF